MSVLSSRGKRTGTRSQWLSLLSMAGVIAGHIDYAPRIESNQWHSYSADCSLLVNPSVGITFTTNYMGIFTCMSIIIPFWKSAFRNNVCQDIA